jgi:hypothetical protein
VDRAVCKGLTSPSCSRAIGAGGRDKKKIKNQNAKIKIVEPKHRQDREKTKRNDPQRSRGLTEKEEHDEIAGLNGGFLLPLLVH